MCSVDREGVLGSHDVVLAWRFVAKVDGPVVCVFVVTRDVMLDYEAGCDVLFDVYDDGYFVR